MTVGIAIAGVAASTLIWLGVATAILRLRAAQIAALPAATRENAVLAPRYDAILGLRVKDLARRHTLGWTAFLLVSFIVMTAARFSVAWLVLFAAALAVSYSVFEFRQGWDERRRLGELNADAPSLPGKAVRVRYIALLAAEWFGYLTALVFTAQAVAGLTGL